MNLFYQLKFPIPGNWHVITLQNQNSEVIFKIYLMI